MNKDKSKKANAFSYLFTFAHFCLCFQVAKNGDWF